MRKRMAELVAVGVVVLVASPVAADETRDDRATTAERLFLEGRVLSERGDTEGACLRFEKSHELEPAAIGPVLNLALCKEALHKYATATALFREVLDASQGSRPDRAELAREHLATLTPKVSTMRIVVPRPPPPGLEVRVDERPWPPATWNTDVPTDGGAHVIHASAPGKTRLMKKVSLDRERGRLVVALPPLEAVRSNAVAGYAIGGGGILLTAVGTVLGVSVANQCGGFFRDTCKDANGLPDDERERRLDRLDTLAWVSNVTIGVGLAAIAVGAYLVLTGKKAETSASSRTGGLGFDAAF
jgi:hypothetical protein